MNFGFERIYSADPWKIIEEKFNSEKNIVNESVFSLANEYMGTRGMLEEGYSDDKTLDGNYIGGIYLKEKLVYVWKRKGFPTYANCMANTANWISIQVEIDGESFNMSESDFDKFYRELDLKEGILRRQLVFKTKSGCETLLKWERFISYADRHMGAVSINIKPLNHNKIIRAQFFLDDSNENKMTKVEQPKICIRKKFDNNNGYLLTKLPSTGQYYIHRMHMENTIGPNSIAVEIIEDRKIGYEYSFLPEQGQEYCFNKLVTVWTSRDAGYPHGLIKKECESTDIDKEKEDQIIDFILSNSKENIDMYKAKGYKELKNRHIEKISEMWDKLDIEIEGDVLAQQGIRYCMFQMTNTYQGLDSYLNIGAKGLTGETYFGRSFWDSESYCLPFYLFTNPTAAKNLVEFRYNTLEEARINSKAFGYKGAKYPWQTIDGSEDCMYWEYAYLEVHLDAIIPYAVRMYTHVTGDNEYLISKGIEVLLETARFWESRVSWDPNRNAYGIYRVTNADEWQMLVNNGFYTNFMAKKALEYTVNVIEMMQMNYPQNLQKVFEKLGIETREIDKWKSISEKLVINYNENYRIFVEDDMFLSLIPFSREEMTREDIPVEKQWCIEKFLIHDVLKQPDVLLAMFLFRNDFTFEEKKNNYRFYEQRTLHGSSLSPCIHSILGAELERYNQAYEYYLWASRLDLDDYNNNTDEGLHVSAMSGTWMNIVYGFGGMVANGELLEFNPIIPDAWSSYSFKVVYRGRVIKLNVDKEKISYQVSSGENVGIRIYGRDLIAADKPESVPISERFSGRAKLGAVIFDLDGVITDTARYHYKAWKQIADNEGIYFDEAINERLKGVNRMESLNIILEKRNHDYSEEERAAIAERKNNIYVKLLDNITPKDILPGIMDFINELKMVGIKTALYSASRNTELIVRKLRMEDQFDVIISGNNVKNAKPHPEGFLMAADKLGVKPESCVVIEDAFAGIEGARAARMKSMGIGQKLQLHNADYVLVSTKYLTYERVSFLF